MGDNIKMDLSGMGFGDVDWVYLAHIGTGGVLLQKWQSPFRFHKRWVIS
jgi:hypothetical protein